MDSLLDKDEVSLEAILDEDDLLQECKSQNTRLIDYFQKVDVLQRLFGYVSGQIEAEDTGKFKCAALDYIQLSLTFVQIPLRIHRGPMQRDLVDCGDVLESFGAAPGAFLGDRIGSRCGGHEDANGHGVPFR